MEQTNTPQQPSRKKAILSLLVLLALTCVVVFIFSSPERLLKSFLGIILLVHFTTFCPHGGQLFRVFNGVLQQDSQLLRAAVEDLTAKK